MLLEEIEGLVERLDLDVVTAGVCLPCLTFVAFPLDLGREAEARREAQRLAPELWSDGLEPTVLLALERARRDGLSGAAEAIHDVRCRGSGSQVVREIVWQLAEDLVEDMRRRRRSVR